MYIYRQEANITKRFINKDRAANMAFVYDRTSDNQSSHFSDSHDEFVTKATNFALLLEDKTRDSLDKEFKTNTLSSVAEKDQLTKSIQTYNTEQVLSHLLGPERMMPKDCVNWTGECNSQVEKDGDLFCASTYSLQVAKRDNVSLLYIRRRA
jgi:hypothetical protein